jgi:hypothetical protein
MQPYNPQGSKLLLAKRQLTQWCCDWCSAPPKPEPSRDLFYPGHKWPFGPLCDSCMGTEAPPLYKLVLMRLPLQVQAAESVTDLVAEYVFAVCAEYAEWKQACAKVFEGQMARGPGQQKRKRAQERPQFEVVQLHYTALTSGTEGGSASDETQKVEPVEAIASDEKQKVDSDDSDDLFADYSFDDNDDGGSSAVEDA